MLTIFFAESKVCLNRPALSTEPKEGSCGYEFLLPELSGLNLPGAS